MNTRQARETDGNYYANQAVRSVLMYARAADAMPVGRHNLMITLGQFYCDGAAESITSPCAWLCSV